MFARTLTYEFDELPLVVSGRFDACHVTGFAEIRYDACGAWSIEQIGFEAVRRDNPGIGRPHGSARGKAWLEIGDPIHAIIYDRLEHDWRSRVQNRVDDQIVDDRNDGTFADRGADHAIALIKELG